MPSAKVIAYNSSSSAHDVEMLLRRSAGDGYYTVARGVIPPDQYWNCISDNGNEWALYRLKMSVVDGSNGCVAGAHVQQSEYEEEWE